MSGANTWIVKVDVDDWDTRSYGDVVQCVTAADTPEQARSQGADLLGVPADRLIVQQYSLGENPAPVSAPLTEEEVAKLRYND